MKLGKVQLDIMTLLWDKGEATARDLTDALSEREPIAHSTVQTLLRTLEAKGAIRHELRDRTFVFKAVWKRDDVETTAVKDLLSRVLRGSAYELVAHLLKTEEVPDEELKKLGELIEAHRAGKGS
jgi:BlaI family penicillinase repressor